MIDQEVKTDSTDELDDWFDGVEEEEDQSAPTEELVEEEPSNLETSSEEDPDHKTPEEAAPEEAASSTGTSEAPVKADSPYAWIEQLDPETRKHAEALVHRESTQTGRVAALRSRLDEVSAKVQAAETAQVAPTPVASTQSIQDTEVDANLKEFTETYPTVADNVQKLIDQRVAKERAQLEAEILPLKERQLAEESLREKTRLREEASRIFNSAETGIELDEILSSNMWREWMESQPAGYQEFARKAGRAEDAAQVLEHFAQYAERKAYEEYVYAQEHEGATDTTNSPSEADQVAAKRAQALQGSGTPSKSGKLKGSELSSYDDWFNYYAEEK
jgi:hypothetical protein